MSKERDTHFEGFAKLVVQKLQEKGLLECWNPDLGEIDQEKVQQARELIAQCAYDLAFYVVETIQYPYLNTVPDMTKWPDYEQYPDIKDQSQ